MPSMANKIAVTPIVGNVAKLSELERKILNGAAQAAIFTSLIFSRTFLFTNDKL
jgi:hypothetical protein